MWIKLLFVLLLHSVKGDSPDVYGCLGGWFELRCTYHNNQKAKQNQNLQVCAPKGRRLSSSNPGENRWSPLDNPTSLYHNTTGKYWRVLVKQLTKNDLGDYKCKNGPKGELDLEDVLENPVSCPESSKVVEIGGNTSIECTHPQVNFMCKERSSSCDILDHGQKLIYFIRNASLQDQGIYWCGYEPSNQGYKVSRQKIHLQAETPLTTSPSHADMSKSSPYPKNTAYPVYSTSPTPTQSLHNQDMSKSTSYTKNTAYPVYSTSPTPTQSLYNQDEVRKILIISATVLGVILLLVLMAFCIHKSRRRFANLTPTNKEEHCYEEIEEGPRQMAPGTALKTIYATASAPQPAPSGPQKNGNMRKTTDEMFKDNVLYSTSGAQ